jgi:hypothetical protein
MIRATATLKGTAAISFSKPVKSKKNTGESYDAFEDRTWKERMHVDEKGIVFIPPMALKNCLSEVAKYLSETVPGKGSAKYTKHFEAGVMVMKPMSLGVRADKVLGEPLFVPADGKRGSGKRVWKTFPFVPSGWETEAEIIVLDPVLIDKPEKIEEYLKFAGQFIGLGRFRPRQNGYYGRFEVTNFRSEKIS